MSNKEIKPFYVDSTDLTDDQIEWLWEVCAEKGNIYEKCDDWFRYKDRNPCMGLDVDLETLCHSDLSLFDRKYLTFDQVADHLGVPPYNPQEASSESRSEEKEVYLTDTTCEQENLNTSLSEAFTLLKDFAKENNICIDFQMDKVKVYPFGEDYYQVTTAEDITEIVNALKVLENYKEEK